MAWTDPRTWASGETVTAALMNTHVRDNFNWLARAGEDGWASFTPTWTGASSNPAIGNGTLQGFYQHIGVLVIIRIDMIAGSTTTFGTGDWSFATPVTMALHSATYGGAGWGLAVDATGPTSYLMNVWTTASTLQVYDVDDDDITDSAVPFTWTTSDELHIFAIGESAS